MDSFLGQTRNVSRKKQSGAIIGRVGHKVLNVVERCHDARKTATNPGSRGLPAGDDLSAETN